MRVAWLAPVLSTLALTTCAESPTTPLLGPDYGPPSLTIGGNSGCYTPNFTTHVVGVFPSFAGTIAGDLIGTVYVEFDPTSVINTGATNWITGGGTWHITGGVIAELIGKTFTTSTLAKNIFAPDNDPLLFELNGRDRALDGIEVANLTFRGGFDAQDLTPPFEVDLQWHGIVCP